MSATEQDTQAAIDRELERGGVPATQKNEPAPPATFRMIGDTRIITSEDHGKLWKSRRDQALAKRRARHEDTAWAEAIDYYNNNQVAYRMDSDGNWSRNEHLSGKMTRGHAETENIVFANTSAIVPAVYAKNPDVAVTADAEEEEYPIAPETVEKLTTRIMQKRNAPGINVKTHARRSVVHTTLTNVAYIEVGYTFRDQSSTQAAEDLVRISEELSKAQDVNEIRRLEGELQALEATSDFLRPPGPWCRFLRCDQVLWDTDSVHEDRSDARWVMYWDYISTAYINARYAKPVVGEDGTPKEYRSIYNPTHVMNAGTDAGGTQKSMAAPDDIYQFSLLDDEKKHTYEQGYYGYQNENAWRRALRTKCWWVWDRVTQRVYLYNDEDWSWPIWVWDDPYHLEGLFPLAQLSFYTHPNEGVGKSEVSYYLDQQDAINQINSEFAQARQWARRNIFFDKNKIDRTDVEKMIKGDESVAIGVAVPEGMKLNDFLESVLPPSMDFIELFDKQPILEAIDRVSSVTAVQRGAEFKTNTTNVAIENYTSAQQTRLDEKIDAVEDMLGRVGWMIAQMCLQYMDQETVQKLIGRKHAEGWQNLSADEITEYYSMAVIGGSTTKPTSSAQKAMALELGQVLGQFVQAAPQATLGVLLRVFDRAFPEVSISDDDWQELHAAVGSRGVPGTSETRDAATEQAEADPISQIAQVVDSLPPEAKEALGLAMARGVPVREALERIMGAAQQQQAPAPA